MVVKTDRNISEDLYKKIEIAKSGFRKGQSLDEIIEKALHHELGDALLYNSIWQSGYDFGVSYQGHLNENEKHKLGRLLKVFEADRPDDIINLLTQNDLMSSANIEEHEAFANNWIFPKRCLEKTDGFWEIGDDMCVDHDVDQNFLLMALSVQFMGRHNIRYRSVIDLWRKGFVDSIQDSTNY
ncbi:hypothetical protein [Desulfogranum mediterraneum]|uniref:hypothetical protein n=1 Tax=Desulfogranum mediterraneum TaxID=160661 RepID=UPI00048BC3CF|nr:hypothetical protein [Desulfogranum mediterraneum]